MGVPGIMLHLLLPQVSLPAFSCQGLALTLWMTPCAGDKNYVPLHLRGVGHKVGASHLSCL